MNKARRHVGNEVREFHGASSRFGAGRGWGGVFNAKTQGREVAKKEATGRWSLLLRWCLSSPRCLLGQGLGRRARWLVGVAGFGDVPAHVGGRGDDWDISEAVIGGVMELVRSRS